ncbi:MAG: alginate export family protein [Gammaproteobacteria bacterium]|nr:alginate export family protein [Gammaproteobacteria bacterium]
MRNLLFILCVANLLWLTPASADDRDSFDYGLQISIERSALDGLSLGDDPSEDRLVEEEYEIEFALEYQVNDDLYLFFTGALIDETETIETFGLEEDTSGLERKEIGVGYFFGKDFASHLRFGRTEFVSASEWWLWWDEELDAIRLDSSFRDFEATLGLAQELARESTDDDFIDPEIDDVKRILLSLAWEFADDQSLILYYLDQTDDSRSFLVGEFDDADELDEEDADLSWTGISYIAGFDIDSVGEFEVELHAARVSGDETVYEFDDPVAGRSEVVEREQHHVNGSAYGYLLSLTPDALDDWTLILGNARGSGDSNPDDSHLKSFRQSGLQGDSESFGELYQPELSNLEVDVIGIEWEIAEGVEVALLRYEYEQRKLADEMRNVSIELDPSGTSRDLGREIDLIVTIEAREGLELIITAAEFDAGKAYGASSRETSNFINFELGYEF